MAIFSGEVTIKVRFKDIQVAVGYGMTSAIIKHRCVQRKLDVYSFESARKSFNTTARILGIEEGIKKTLIGQTDHSIQRHYDNYNDPELVGKVQLAHLGIMHHFKVIELYELWLKKLEDLFGAQNDNLYVGASSDIVYMDHYNRLPGILKSDRTEISKKPFWVDKLMVSK